MPHKNQTNLKEKIIFTLLEDGIFTKKHLFDLQRKICQKEGCNFFRTIDLLKTYHNLAKSGKLPLDFTRNAQAENDIKKLLTMKHVRSQSGIVVVSVLTKPYPCPGKCIYCPTEKNVPKSYLSNEPAVMRAIALNYDPYIQTSMRLKSLEEEGHPTDKINIRVIGGTWSAHPKKYKEWFIREIFRACNGYEKTEEQKNRETEKQEFERGMSPRAELIKFQHQNETAKHRIVEISIETRQDFINIEEIQELRKYGVTKVELGVQSIYDNVLKKNLRGHNKDETIRATKLLKDAGFKVSYQMMLNLFGSSIKRDQEMFEKLFSDPDFKPDHIKIYPLALVKKSKLYNFYKKNQFNPYTKNQLIKLLISIKKYIPYYCRVERVIRDIPSESIVEGGTKFSNMRQMLQKKKIFCKCIRCRESKDHNCTDEKMFLFVNFYDASDGKEYFISFENKNQTKLFSMLRLRIPSQTKYKKHFLKTLESSAIIREIHTYGQQIEISKSNQNAPQHKGLGKMLIAEAEKIAKNLGAKKVAVIAGVGTREYFKHLGYKLKNSYMIKTL